MPMHYYYLPGAPDPGMFGAETTAWMISPMFFWLALAVVLIWLFGRHPSWFARHRDMDRRTDQPPKTDSRPEDDETEDDADSKDPPDTKKKRLPLDTHSHTPPGVPPGLF